MTRYFASRHPGAIAWAHRHGVGVDKWIDHLDPRCLTPGDVVMGILPIHLVGDICARGVIYAHLQIDVSQLQRGRELNADVLDALGACLVRYRVDVGETFSNATTDVPNV